MFEKKHFDSNRDLPSRAKDIIDQLNEEIQDLVKARHNLCEKLKTLTEKEMEKLREEENSCTEIYTDKLNQGIDREGARSSYFEEIKTKYPSGLDHIDEEIRHREYEISRMQSSTRS